MPIDPSIPLQIKPPTVAPLQDVLSKGIQLRDMMAQIQLRNAQVDATKAQAEQRQRDLEDQTTLGNLQSDPGFQKAFGSASYPELANYLGGKVQAKTVQDLYSKSLTASQGIATLTKDKQERLKGFHAALENGLPGLDPTDDNAAASQASAFLDTLHKDYPEFGDHLPPPGTVTAANVRDVAKQAAVGNGVMNAMLKTLAERQKTQIEVPQASAQLRNTQLTGDKLKAEIPGVEADTMVKVAEAPTKIIETKATARDPNLLNPQQRQQATESARAATETNRHNLAEESIARNRAALETGVRRSDASYQANTRELDAISKPISDAATRISRLTDTLDQNTPQADIAVAPELMIVLAGGAGSGLRINEAEITNITHGRSKWEDLKAAVNKYSLDPKTATNITPEQRREIRALAKMVSDKVYKKQEAVNEAYTTLVKSDKVEDHRNAVLKVRQELAGIDQNKHQVNDIVRIGGKRVKISKINPDGTFEGDEVK